MGQFKLRTALILSALLWPCVAGAQDAALDDKLRDMLRQMTTQLRAAEDNAATMQASLDTMTKQRDQLQQQLSAAQSKPATPAVTPQQLAAMQQAQAGLTAARAQNAQLAAEGQRLQDAYAKASAMARDKDESDRRNAAGLKMASGALSTCKADNTKLIDLSGEILHLYETPQFNRLLVANHERLIGFARVKLENLVQDYEDKMAAQTYVGP